MPDYPHVVTYYDATSQQDWVRPSTGYTLRTSSAADAPFVREFNLRQFVESDPLSGVNRFGNRVQVPNNQDEQQIFVNMADHAATWRGTIPAGTALSNDEGTAATLTRCEVARDFTVTDSSILPGLQDGGNPLVEGPYQPMLTRNWSFAQPRNPSPAWYIITPMEVIPADVAVSVGQPTWVRFTDIGTAITPGFGSESGETVRTAERVRTFVVDSFVVAAWHEGDYILSEGEYYTIQARRVISAREIEFDAEAKPTFRLVAPPEDMP